MRYRLCVNLSILLIFSANSIGQPVLKFEENKSLTWQETIDYYQYLDNQYPDAKLLEAGTTDSGKPLHLFIISQDGLFDPELIRENAKLVVLINNGIHPGESCGVDASIKLAENILNNPDEYKKVLDNTVIAIIPVLNVGGALNRSKYHRANQNGPEFQGFRGNAMNMDLNRDFMKLDTRNAISLVKIMREWDPDILIDTHTSNGADYPYVLTLIGTQKDKLNSPLSDFMTDKMLPELYLRMRNGPYEMIPYVMSRNYRNPENGIVAFIDYPRYTTGYASLFSCIGFTTEAHMFKKFSDRVMATYYFILNTVEYASENNYKIASLRALAKANAIKKNEFVLQWELDTSYYEPLLFKGYEMETSVSDLTGLPNYSYNRNKPWEKEIPYYTTYKPVKKITPPDFYVIPQAWQEIIQRLEINNIHFSKLKKDTSLLVEYYYIDDFESYDNPYNGHYKHFNVKVSTHNDTLSFYQGDVLVPVKQSGIQYIIQALEPEGEDSFFSWNFFDSVLSRKEYFSPYVFEEKAKDILASNPWLEKEFRDKQQSDPEFAKSHYAQLRFIYERSEYSEPTYRRYPVARFSISE